jgi:hypothetical protein
MNRYLLNTFGAGLLTPPLALVLTFALSGLLTRQAAAQCPQRTVVVAQPTVVVNNGATYGYGAGGYGVAGYNSYGYGNYGYGAYGGYGSPYIMPGSAPYGAGYSGGWQPYQQMYYQRLYYGLGTFGR